MRIAGLALICSTIVLVSSGIGASASVEPSMTTLRPMTTLKVAHLLVAYETTKQVAAQCQPYGEGCHSCVADGVWGALWHNADCSTECHKICGSEPADQ